MAQITIGSTRIAQATSGTAINAMFSEIYARVTRTILAAKTSAFTFTVPAGYVIEHLALANTTANAVNGGLKAGTTLGGTDVIATTPATANSIQTVPGASFAKRIFSQTVDQTIYVDAVTGWASASVDVVVVLRKIYG